MAGERAGAPAYVIDATAYVVDTGQELLTHPLALRLRPGSSHGVVMPALFVDNEWVDGRPMARDEKGNALPPMDLLTEVQILLRQSLSVEMLPHQLRHQRSQTA